MPTLPRRKWVPRGGRDPKSREGRSRGLDLRWQAPGRGYAFLITGLGDSEEERGLEARADVVKALGTCWLVAAALGLGWQRAGLAWVPGPGPEVAGGPAVQSSIMLRLSLALRFSKHPGVEGTTEKQVRSQPVLGDTPAPEPPGASQGPGWAGDWTVRLQL